MMVGIHDLLRNRFRWYYNWHMNSWSDFVHWTVLAGYISTTVFLLFTLVFKGPTHQIIANSNSKQVLSSKVWSSSTDWNSWQIDNLTTNNNGLTLAKNAVKNNSEKSQNQDQKKTNNQTTNRKLTNITKVNNTPADTISSTTGATVQTKPTNTSTSGLVIQPTPTDNTQPALTGSAISTTPPAEPNSTSTPEDSSTTSTGSIANSPAVPADTTAVVAPVSNQTSTPEPGYTNSGTAKIAFTPKQGDYMNWTTVASEEDDNGQTVKKEFSTDKITWTTDITQLPTSQTLYIQITLTTTDSTVTPIINSLEVDYSPTIRNSWQPHKTQNFGFETLQKAQKKYPTKNAAFTGNYDVTPIDQTLSISMPNHQGKSRIEIDKAATSTATDLSSTTTISASSDQATIKSKSSGTTPGLYKITAKDAASGQIIGQETEAWGVLAFNPDYAVYKPGANANISMGVLDDNGHMICDADLTLKITDPNGKKTTLSTSDGSILVNDACFVYGPTNNPDYQANYQTTSAGTYSVTLIAKVGSGTRTLHDQFSVKTDQPFYLQELGPTRTYPPVNYTYTLNFDPQVTGNFQVQETVPASFQIGNTDAQIKTGTDTTMLSWPVTAIAGQNQTLSFGFIGPDISPYLFTFGPVQVTQDDGSVWQEPRQWEIASDAGNTYTCTTTTTGTWNWNTSGNWGGACGGGAFYPGYTASPDTYNVNINSAGTTVINLTGSYNDIGTITIIGNGFAHTLNFNGNTITTTGLITISAPTAAVVNTIAVDTGTLNAGAGITITAGGTAGYNSILSATTGTIADTGNITMSGTGTAQISTSGAANVSISGCTMGTAGSLSLSATTSFTATATNQINGAYTFGGTFTVSSGTTTLGNYAIVVTGATSVTGTLGASSGNFTKTFNGLVTINSGGAWSFSTFTGTELFAAGITNNSSSLMNVTNSTGSVTFQTASQNLTGSTAGISFGTGATLNAGIVLTNNIANNPVTFGSTVTGSSGTSGISTGLNSDTIFLASGTNTLSTGVLTPYNGVNTIEYNYAGAQTIHATTTYGYWYLKIGGASGAKTAGGALTVNGDFTIGGGSSFAGGSSLTHTFLGNWVVSTTVAATPFTFTTASTINFNTPGTPAATSITGANTQTITFNIVNINNTSGFSIATSGASTTVPISASGAFTVASTVTATNNSTVTLTSSLAGLGGFTNAGTGTLNLNFTGTVAISTLTATASGNTVSYGFNGTATMLSTTYWNLTIAGTSGAKSAGGALTVNGNFTLSGAATFTAGSYTHTFLGNWVNNSTAATPITATGSTINFNTPGTPAATSITGANTNTLAFVTVNVNNTSGFSISTSGAPTFSPISASGAFTVATGVTVTNNGAVTLTNSLAGSGGFTNAGTGTLNINFAAVPAISTLTATASSNTVVYGYAGAQTIKPSTTYYNLMIQSSGAKTLTNVSTINGTFTVGGTCTATASAAMTIGVNLAISGGTLTAGNTIAVTGNLTASTGTLALSTYSLTVTGSSTLSGGTVTIGASSSTGWTTAGLTISSGTITCTGISLINDSGIFSNAGTFTPGSSVVTMTSTAANQTINPGAASFYNLTFNGAGGEWSPLTNTVTVTNNLTMTAGTFDTVNGTASVAVNGNVQCGVTCGTINMTSTNTFTQNVAANKNFGTSVTDTTAWAFYNLTFTKSSGTPTITTSTAATGGITVSNVLTIAASTTLNTGNRTWTLSGTGTPFVNSGTFTPSTSTISYTGGSAGVNVTATTYNNLTINNTLTTFTAAGTITVSGVFTLTAGTFNAPSSATMYVAGNFTNSGTFNSNLGTVNLNGAGSTTQVVSGSTSFYNLYSTAATARTIQFAGSSTQTVTGTWTVTGVNSQPITLTLKTGDTGTWNINPTAWSVSYVTVSNSVNQAGSAICPISSSDGGSNTNWFSGWMITASADANGTISPSGSVGASNGVTQAFTFSANGGYYISTLIVDGVAQSTLTSPYTFTNVTANHSIAVTTAVTNTCVWTGLGSDTNWSTTLNWSGNTVPVSTCDVIFNSTSTAASSLDSGFTNHIKSLSINSGYTNTITAGVGLNDDGNFTLAAGTFSAGSYTHNISGSWNATGGTFTPSTSTTNFNATATGKTITSASQPFNILTFTGTGGGWTLQDNLTATTLTVTAGGLTDNGVTVTVNGNISIANVGGALVSTGSWIQGATGTISNPYSSSNSFRNLSISGTGVTTTLANNVFVGSGTSATNDGLTIGSGTLYGAGRILYYYNYAATDTLTIGTPTIGSALSSLTFNANVSQTMNAKTFPNGFGTIRIYTQGASSIITAGGNLNFGNNAVHIYSTATGSTQPTNYLDMVSYSFITTGILSMGDISGNTNGYLKLGSSTSNSVGGITTSGTGTGNILDLGTGTTANSGNISFTGIAVTASASTINMTATATGKTITSASQPFNILTFTGTGGGWTLQDSLTAAALAVTAGGLTDNGQTVTVNGNISIANAAGSLVSTGSWVQGATGTISNPYNYTTAFRNLSIAGPGVTTTLAGNVFTGSSSSATNNGLTIGSGTLYGAGFTLSLYNDSSTNTLIVSNPTIGSALGGFIIYNYANQTMNAVTFPNSFATYIALSAQGASNSNLTANGNLNFGNNDVHILSSATGSTQPTTYVDMATYSLSTTGILSIGDSSGNTNGYLKLGSSTSNSVGGITTSGTGTGNVLDLGTGTTANSGNISFTGIAVTANTSTVNMTATTTSKTITSAAQSFNNLTFNGIGGGWTAQDDTNISGALTMTNGTFTSGANNVTTVNYSQGGGTFTAPTSTKAMNVSGNFTNTAGTFTAPVSSTMNLTGAAASTQVISGNNTFVNLSATATLARTIQFAGSSTQTVTGTWTVTGATSQLITLALKTGDAGTWNINPTAWSISYVSVSNSVNQAYATIYPTGSTDGGGNSNWFTATNTCTWTGLGSDNNWSTAGNWSSSIIPSTSCNVVFDSTSTKISSIDASFTNHIASLSINSGYTGTITAGITLNDNGGFTLAQGTFDANGQNINAVNLTANGSLVRTLKMSSGTWTISGNWDSSGTNLTQTFATSTVDLTGSGTIDAGSGQHLYNLKCAHAGQTTTLTDHLWLNNVLNTYSTGTLTGSSNIIYFYNSTSDPFIDTGATLSSNSFSYMSTQNLSVTGHNFPTSVTYRAYTNNVTYTLTSGLSAVSTISVYSQATNMIATLDAGAYNISTANFYLGNTTYAGAVNFEGGTHTITGNLKLAASVTSTTNTINLGSSNISITGNIDFTGITVTQGTSTITMNSTTTGKTITSASQPFNNLTFSGSGGAWAPQDNLTVNGTLTVTNGAVNSGANTIAAANYSQGGGTFTAPSTNLNVTGNFTHSSGTFTHNSGTVNLIGAAASTQVVSGNTTFNNLTIPVTTGARTVQFAGSSTQTVTGTWTVTGSGGQLITLALKTGDAGTWNINPTAWSVSYVSVSNSVNQAGSLISPTSSTDGGGNTNWFTGPPPTNDSVTFTNPYSSDIAVADNSTSWDFQAQVTDSTGATDINYIEMRFANSTDSSQPYDSLKYRWTRSTNTFSQQTDTQGATTITSTGSDASSSGNQWTVNFKIQFNSNFAATSTNYAIELYSINNTGGSTDTNYANTYQVAPLSISLTLDNSSLTFGNLLPGSVFTGSTQTTVTTNYPNGYTLSVNDNMSGSNSPLIHDDGTTYIADYSGTVTTPTSWSGTGLGICPYIATGKDAKWGTGTTASDSFNKYAGIPQNATVINTKTASPTTADQTSVGYKLVVPNSQKTGNYSGNVLYTVTGSLP
jgi:hypothetical protein